MAATIRIFPSRFGEFELQSQLGRGGMATVYLARHPKYNGEVALKIAHETEEDDPHQAQRFKNEYVIGSRYDHPHLVKVLEHGLEDSRPYLVLELVDGGTLDARIKASGPMPLDEAIAVIRQMCEVLDFVHQHGAIHRDIKPANILLDKTGNAKLTDLGLIKDKGSNIHLTRSRTALGRRTMPLPSSSRTPNESIIAATSTLWAAPSTRPSQGFTRSAAARSFKCS